MVNKNCYSEAFYKLEPYGDLKRLVRIGDLKKIHKRVYSILCTEYLPSYFEKEKCIISYITNKFFDTNLIVFPQRGNPFENTEQINNYINDTTGNYYFFLKKYNLPIDRRIVINTNTQEEARLVLDKLTDLMELEKHQISRVKIFLRSDPFNRIKRDKIVVYYKKKSDLNNINIDKNGAQIILYQIFSLQIKKITHFFFIKK